MGRTVQGIRVTLLGLGTFGGGIGAARYLCRQGARVTVTDLRSEASLRESLRKLEGLPIRYHLRGHREEDFIETDLVVASPAVPKHSPYLEMARRAGIPVTTELGLFLDRCPARVIGVTGTNGKSTVTSLIGSALSAAGARCFVGGNLGGSLLDVCQEIRSSDWVVIEMSSFQLEALADRGFSPPIAVVTSLSPNHLDRHGDMESYASAKAEILCHQAAGDVAILNGEDAALVDRLGRVGRGRRVWFGLSGRGDETAFLEGGRAVLKQTSGEVTLFAAERLRIVGEFNLRNAMAAAVAASVAVGRFPEASAHAIESFAGLEHRLERVLEDRGVLYVNDSKATTPDAAVAALSAIRRPIVLLSGGKSKGAPMNALGRAISGRCKGVVLFGPAGEALSEHIAAGDSLVVRRCQRLADAMRAASELAQPGDCVLLSPGFASFDEFASFEERGRLFKALTRRIAEGGSNPSAQAAGAEMGS